MAESLAQFVVHPERNATVLDGAAPRYRPVSLYRRRYRIALGFGRRERCRETALIAEASVYIQNGFAEHVEMRRRRFPSNPRSPETGKLISPRVFIPYA